MDRRLADRLSPRKKVSITEACDGCRYCTTQFECPALVYDEEGKRVDIDMLLCTGCGICLHVCPIGAIREEPPEGGAA
jgi:indolepyruvate ferredoxin oxidoreductase alpha subunit